MLRYIPWGTDVTPTNAKNYEMQARAMRVFYYNMLWHYFGNIPFYLENLSAPYTAPQLKADEVYAELIRELEEVIDSKVLPLRWDNANAGRASQSVGISWDGAEDEEEEAADNNAVAHGHESDTLTAADGRENPFGQPQGAPGGFS